MSPQAALIYTMVLMSAADSEMTDSELGTIGDIVRHLPIFRDFDPAQITQVATSCAEMLQEENGLDAALKLIREALPLTLADTAYALACDVAAADGKASQEELRLLEMLSFTLGISRLSSAAIEHAAKVRYTKA